MSLISLLIIKKKFIVIFQYFYSLQLGLHIFVSHGFFCFSLAGQYISRVILFYAYLYIYVLFIYFLLLCWLGIMIAFAVTSPLAYTRIQDVFKIYDKNFNNAFFVNFRMKIIIQKCCLE